MPNDVHLFGAAVVKKFRGFPQLRAAHQRIVNEDQPFVPDQVSTGSVSCAQSGCGRALLLRHKRTRPGRGIFDKRTRKGNCWSDWHSDGMRRAGIGSPATLSASTLSRAPAYRRSKRIFFDIDPFIAGGGITIIDPQKRADFHFCLGEQQSAWPRASENRSRRASSWQSSYPRFNSKRFKRSAVGAVPFCHDDRRTANRSRAA